jgi:4-amino-4-deoxychorismate lyase
VDALWLVNGRREALDPADRGVAYGDGVFETMAAHDGEVRRLTQHLERLASGCRRLAIDPPDEGTLRAEIAAHVPAKGRAVVKLIVTRGPGARGYAPPTAARPTRILSISSWPSYPRHHYTAGMNVRTCELRLGRNQALAGLKHLNRLEQVLASAEVRAAGADEGLMLDSEGCVVGATSNNVFAVRGNEVVTPAVTRCGIAGVMRRAVLDAAPALGLAAAVRDVDPAELRGADEVFLCNAVAGIRPVAMLDDVNFNAARPVTGRLIAHFSSADGVA